MRMANGVATAVLATLVLTGAAAAAMSVAPRGPVDVGSCPGAANEGAVGAVVVLDEAEAARFPGLSDPAFEPPADGAPYVLAAAFPEGTRLIPPGTMVTRDHRPGRLNVETDAAGAVLRVACG